MHDSELQIICTSNPLIAKMTCAEPITSAERQRLFQSLKATLRPVEDRLGYEIPVVVCAPNMDVEIIANPQDPPPCEHSLPVSP